MKHSHAELERAKAALWHLPCPGNREEWWPIVGSALAEGIDEDELMRWCASGDGFKESDVIATIKSLARRHGTGGGSLFKLARDAGWRDEASPLPVGLPKRKPLAPAKPPPHDPKTVWDACNPVPASHPYITRKRGLPDGLRVYSGSLTIAGQSCDGALVLPCFTLDGQLVTLQFVPPEGKKLFLPGVSIPEGACLVIGGQIAGKTERTRGAITGLISRGLITCREDWLWCA